MPAFGKPEQRRVGDELQVELEPALLARLAHLRRVGRPPARASRSAGSLPAAPPRATVTRAPAWARSATQLAGLAQRTCVPTGTLRSRVVPAAAVLAGPCAVDAALGAEVRGGAKARQVAQVGARDQDDVAAVAAVAAVRAALRHELLAPEADAAVAAAAALRPGSSRGRRTPPAPSYADCSASTLM